LLGKLVAAESLSGTLIDHPYEKELAPYLLPVSST
jgi:hypothetical protein